MINLSFLKMFMGLKFVEWQLVCITFRLEKISTMIRKTLSWHFILGTLMNDDIWCGGKSKDSLCNMYSLGDDCMPPACIVSYEIFLKLANHFSKRTNNLMLRRQFSCIVICCTFGKTEFRARHFDEVYRLCKNRKASDNERSSVSTSVKQYDK